MVSTPFATSPNTESVLDNTPHVAAQCTATHNSTMHCNALQRTGTHCNALQRTATHCNALQRTATHLEEDMASKSFDAPPNNNDLVLENTDLVLENPPSPSPLSYPHNLRQNHESKHSGATVNR